MQYGWSGSVGGSVSPLVHCRSVGLSVEFEHVFSEFDARGEFLEANFPKKLPQFCFFYPEPNFRKKMLQFWDVYPEPNFPQNLPYVWNFFRIQTLGAFIFRYFEFTVCVCDSFDVTIGSIVTR